MSAVSTFTGLAFLLLEPLDQGESLDLEETQQHIGDGSLFSWLANRFRDIDLTLLGPEQQADVTEQFQDMSGTGNPLRTYAVEHNGLALLIAYCLEGAQRAARTV